MSSIYMNQPWIYMYSLSRSPLPPPSLPDPFSVSQFFTSGGQSIGVSASSSVLQMNIQDWFLLGLTDWISLQSGILKSLLQHHSSKASILWYSGFFIIQLSYPYMTTAKTIALTKWNLLASLSVQFSSVAQSGLTLFHPMNCSTTPGLPVHHQLPEFTQTHVHWVGNAIQQSHSLLSPSPPSLNLS